MGRIFAKIGARCGKPGPLIAVDTYLKGHRTAASQTHCSAERRGRTCVQSSPSHISPACRAAGADPQSLPHVVDQMPVIARWRRPNSLQR